MRCKNFSLDVDSFVHGFLGDIVKTVQKETKPLEPFIDAFDTPVPILSAFDGTETVGDLLLKGAAFSQDQQDRFDLMVKVIKAVNTIDLSGNTGGAVVDFGDISLTGDARVPFGSPGGFNFDTSQLGTGPLGSAIDQIVNNPVLQEVKGDLESFASDAGLTSTAGFQFPLLDDPGPVLSGILTGQPKDMFTYSTGREHFDLSASIGVGIPDVLGVFLSAGIVFDADFSMGYDTAGLIKFFQDPGKNPEDLLHGFYFDNGIDTTDASIPNVPQPRDTAVYLHGYMELEGSAGATLAGGLYADLNYELASADTSSHVYLDSMIQDLASHGKVFNATGKFYAAASVSLTLPNPVGPDITLFDYKLGEYDIVNNEPPPPPPPGVPLVVVDVTDQHTLLLDTSKMTPGSVVTVEPLHDYGVTVGSDTYLADGIQVDYPNEIDLFVERKDDVDSNYYNLIGFNGPAPNDVTITIDDPFRVFADEGVPDPAPLRRRPAYC